MANLFSGVKDPLIQGTGSITDYQTSAGERFASELEGAFDTNPLAQGARMARYAIEANAPFFGLESNMVSPEVAKEELKSRGLEGHITVPEGGMSRVEFDSIQYLKQRELSRQAKSAMNQSTFAHIAGFAGGLVGSAVDPINIASAFVPIVREARLEAMLAKAGSSVLGRAGVRAQVGAAEGVAGALMIEPFTYAMSQYEQMDYTPADSFMNVVFGGLLGGGLHMAGGAVYDWRATRALNSLQRGLDGMNMRDMAPDLQDEVQLDILRRFTEAEENGAPLPDADKIIAQRMTPDQRSAVQEADGMPGEVPTPTRADGQPSQPKGLDELIPEAKADRTAETFNRQFLDKEQGDVAGFSDVRPPREDIFEVAQANFVGRTQHTAKTVPIDQLSGGVSADPAEAKRVSNLVDLMSGPNGYLERLIVDTDGNVIEGQHRLEALRKMGVKEVPVIEIRELREGLPVDRMMDAMQEVRGLHRDQARQIIDQIAEAIADVGSVAEVRAQYAPPRGFERAWEAALNAAEAADDLKAQSAPAKDASGKFTKAFWRWFKDSKVVDADGNPLVVYHGTDAYIEAFDPRMRGSVTGTSDAKVAFWFTASEARARAAANEAMEVSGTNLPAHEDGLIKVYLSLQNPKIITQDIREMLPSQSARLIRKAQRDGHDGVIFEKGEGGLPDYAVFEPTKIKSADRNRGTYDPELADIRAQSDIVDDAAGPNNGLTPYTQTLGGQTDVNQTQSPDVLGTQETGLRLLTGVRRSPGILPPSPAWSDTAPLAFLPTTVKVPGVGTIEAGAFPLARKTARDYVESTGRAYDPITTYRKVDPARAGRIAEAFEQMRHEPDNPEVKAAYEAMVKETLAQWEAVKRTGLVVEFIDISKGDPYAASPRLATEDVRNNNHLWVFATDDGFGTDGITAKDESDNPLFQIVPGEKISGKQVRANDIFRIVHDYFGHIKDGVGFRADGEENAWRSHSRMYSPLAARAMTTETRGQNSWLNYGPYGEKNRTALTQDTIFAEQKIGLLPDWVMWEGLDDLPIPVPEDRTLADELGFGNLKMMGEPLDPADGPDAPKVIGTDAAGRPVLDFRNSVVSHFTDQESADNINEFGYRVVGDGYYGEAISFTPNREFGAQFGGVETTARISPDARILNTGVPEDAQIIQSVLNNRHLVPNNPRPGMRSWRQEFLRLGIDGVYDPGAGDLFIYNERVVRPTAMDELDDIRAQSDVDDRGGKASKFKYVMLDNKDQVTGPAFDTLEEAQAYAATQPFTKWGHKVISRAEDLGDKYALRESWMLAGKDHPHHLKDRPDEWQRSNSGGTRRRRKPEDHTKAGEADGLDDLKTMIGDRPVAPDTPEFKRWFGGSKVVDEDGKPLVVHHGTPNGEFFEFEKGRPGTTTFIGIPVKTQRHGFFFAEDKAFSQSFAEQGGSRTGAVMSVYLSIKNPLRMTEIGVYWKDIDALVAQGVDRKWLEEHAGDLRTTWEAFDDEQGAWFVERIKQAGYDGVYFRELNEATDEPADVWVAFEPTQIKSATDNSGNYDPDLDDIRAQSDVDESGVVMDEDGGIEVWHASPHDFDRFDLSKIGTGEGNQSYSHGLYFAESEEVSGVGGDYYKNFTNLVRERMGIVVEARYAEDALAQNKGDVQAAIADLKSQIERPVGDLTGATPEFIADLRRLEKWQRGALALLESGKPIPRAKVYKSKLRVRNDQLIDWDKSLAEQSPRVQQFFKERFQPKTPPKLDPGLQKIIRGVERALGREEAAIRGPEDVSLTIDNDRALYDAAHAYAKQKLTPEQYEALEDSSIGDWIAGQAGDYIDAVTPRTFTGNELMKAVFGSPTGANQQQAAALRDAGIKGLKYLDANSRGMKDWLVRHPKGGINTFPTEAQARKYLEKNEGTLIEPKITSNYVIFDDEVIDIIDKFQSDLDEQPDLVAAHNLTAANLLHADKMGGIATPSLAIAKASDGHEGYGEITLIGSKDLVDPQKGANVYAGDIYSARYPTVHYNIKYESLRKLDKQFAATAKEMGVTLRDTLDDDALEREGPRALENSVGALLAYAKEKGVKVDGYLFDRDAWEVRNNEAQAKERAIRDEWQAKRDEEQQRAKAEGRDPDETALDAEMQPKYMEARREANSILREPDRALDEIKYKLRDKFRNDSGFAEWAEGKFAELKAKERIFKGFSNTTGAKMYTAHTLDNVVKLMTKKIRDAEGFNYGIGNLRAKVAPKFRSVEAIRGRKGSLVKREEFDAIKKEADAELMSIADQLLPKLKYKGNSFGQLDALTQHMAEAIDRNNVKRVFQEYYNNLTDDDVRMVGNFLQKLKSMPTTYFEAKLDRAVQIGEFEAAIVPNTISKKAREVLERSGVKQIIEYDPAVDGSRQAAIDSIRDMKFQSDLMRDLGFFSAMEKSIKDADLKSGTGAQWLGYLKNRPGVKAEEMDNSGISDFLTENANEKLTKEQVLQHAKDNAVELEEVTLGVVSAKWDDNKRSRLRRVTDNLEEIGELPENGSEDLYNGVLEGNEDAIEIISRLQPDWNSFLAARPKYEEYTLPGGRNYREVLLTLPAKPEVVYTKDNIIPIKPGDRDWADDHKRFWYFLAPDNSFQILKKDHPTQQGALDYIIEKKQPEPSESRQFRSTHFVQRNILAHARISDRVTESGKKALHVEEIQSDWHQQGRDKGYSSQANQERFTQLEALIQAARDRIQTEQYKLYKKVGYNSYMELRGDAEAKKKFTELQATDKDFLAAVKEHDDLITERNAANPVNKVPDAPFKKTWHELMLKRLIRMAVEKGYDEIVITRGQDIAERFDLSNQVDRIGYTKRADGKWNIVANQRGETLLSEEAISIERVAELVGKEMAQKIEKTEGNIYNRNKGDITGELTGLDLKVGGEGMKGFYDKIVVDFLNKYGKKYGAKVGTDMIDTKSADADLGTVAVHAFPITDAMRTEVMKGQMLFQRDVVDVNAKDTVSAGPYTYTKMDTERRQRSEALRDAIEDLITKYTGGRAQMRWYSSISQKAGGKIHKVDGGFSSLRGIIVMALDAADMVGSAKHEALHFLKDRGLISDVEWDTLVRTALREKWMDKKYGGSRLTVKQRYAHLPDMLDILEEAIAEQFRAGRYDNFQGFHPAIRPILIKLRKFFDAVAKEARKIFGMEATAEDIFRAIESGEIGRRADVEKAKVEAAAIMDAPQRSAPQQMKNQSTPEEDPLRVDRWAADDIAIAAEATDDSKRKDETLQDIEADTAILGAHLDSMRQRGLLSQEDEADLLASNDTARMMEEQAAAYEAAGICEGEE